MSKQRNGGNKNDKSGWIGYGCKIQCLNNQDLLVEGCKGVLKYEQEEICLNVGSCQLLVTGMGLNIPVLERNFVQIQGTITKIEFI